MLLRTEREPSQVWQEDPAMHQLHRASGIRGSGFSHPPLLLASKEHKAHSASRGWGWYQAAKCDVSDRPSQDASAQRPHVYFHPTHPARLDPLSPCQCLQFDLTSTFANNPSSLKCFPLSQRARVHMILRAFQLFLSVSGQELDERRGLLDLVPSKGGDWHRLLFAGPSVCPPSSTWRKDSKTSLSLSQEAGRVDGVKAGGRVALPSEPVRLSAQEWE